MNSEERINELKGTLEQLVLDLDNTYYSMKKELEDEILQRKENIEKLDEETKRVYGKLSYKVCEKIIKSELPLRVKLFNKIKCNGFGVYKTGHIIIYSLINNSFPFVNIYSVSVLKELLKIKDGD